MSHAPHHKATSGRFLALALLSVGLVAAACSSESATSLAPDTSETIAPSSATTAPPITAPPNTTAPTTAPTTSAPTTTAPPSTAPGDGDIDAYLDQLAASGFDGVVAVRDGENIATRAFGVADRESDVEVDTETVFDIGSISKQFTAAAILHMEMDGRLSVDDTLGEHVRGLPDDKAAITLHQLLTHTAGVPNALGPDEEPLSRADFLARVADAPLESEPGDQFAYSNVGYALLGAVIEFETSEPYETYLHTNLFEPAGMLDTGYVLPDWSDHTIAVGYEEPNGTRFGQPNEQPWDADGPYWNLRANGGLLSTAADMLRWDEALNTDDVLNADAKAKFFQPHVAVDSDESASYGYGWLVIPTPTGTPVVTHDGGNGIFWADFWRFTDQDVTVFVATNSFEAADASLGFDIANHALGGLLDELEDGEDEPEVALCEFAELTIDTLPSYPEIETLPDSPAGQATALLLGLLADGDAAGRLDFATKHVSADLGGDDPALLAQDLAGLQRQFGGYTVERVLQQDEQQFHVLMTGPAGDILFSVGFDATDPAELACLAITD